MAVPAIGAFLVALAAPAAMKVLAAIGIGLVSYAAILTAVKAAINSAASAYGAMTGDVLGILGLMGAPEALSVIGGALVARATLLAVSKLAVIPGS